MRVVFVAWRHLPHPEAGGSEVLIDRLAGGLVDRGHEVALLAGGPVTGGPPRRYHVQRAGGTYGQYLRVPIHHARHYRDCDVLIDVENGLPYFSPLWRRRPVVCLVHHVHAEQWEQRFHPLVAAAGRLLEHRLMPLAYRRKQFVCVSASTREDLALLRIDPAQITVVPNGVEAPASHALPTRSSEPLFVALGRLVANKRVEFLLRAWERVRPVTGGRLVVIGDGPARIQLQKMAGPGVRFAGRVDDAVKWRLLASSWLLVHAATREGWGISVMEAAAVGTPAVGFDVQGIRDAIADGVSGVLVRNEVELVTTWIRLARDSDERNRLGEGARRRAEEFTWARTVDEFEKVIQRVVGNERDRKIRGAASRLSARGQQSSGFLSVSGRGHGRAGPSLPAS